MRKYIEKKEMLEKLLMKKRAKFIDPFLCHFFRKTLSLWPLEQEVKRVAVMTLEKGGSETENMEFIL